jgi:hypothetical protein
MTIDKLTLITGAPVILEEIGITLYQPKLKEIGVIGEKKFYSHLSLLLIGKNTISNEFKNLVEGLDDFYIFLSFINASSSSRFGVENILQLMISDLQEIIFSQENFILKMKSGQDVIIQSEEFSILKEAIKEIFALINSSSELNPANDAAKRIAEKLKKRKEKLSKINQESEDDSSSLSNLISILSVGTNSNSLKDLENFTIYQLFNSIKRFGLYEQHKYQVEAMMQGAENVELVDWHKKI